MSQGTTVIARPLMPYQRANMLNLLGGVNNAVSDDLIAANELADARNYHPDSEDAGVLVKRLGTNRICTFPKLPSSIHDGLYDIWTYAETKVYDDGGNAESPTFTDTAASSWASFDSMDIVCNGTEVYKATDASTWAVLGGTPPAFKYIQVYNRFLFGGGHDAGKVRWSNPDDPETWDADNEWNLSPDANDDVIGLKRYKDFLVVMMEKSFYHLRGYDEKSIYIGHRGEPGGTSHHSIVATPYGLFWWSHHGIIWSPDGFLTENISQLKIPKTIEGLNKAKYGIIHGVWNQIRQRIEWYVCNGTSTTPDMAIYYYPRIGVSEVNGIPVGSFWIMDGEGTLMTASTLITSSGEKKIYLAGEDGLFNQSTNYDQGDADLGLHVTAYLETKRDATEYGPAAVKRTKSLIPLFGSVTEETNLNYSVMFDNERNIASSWDIEVRPLGFQLDSDILDQDLIYTLEDETREVEVGISEKFRKIKHRITDNEPAQTKIRGVRNEGYLIKV